MIMCRASHCIVCMQWLGCDVGTYLFARAQKSGWTNKVHCLRPTQRVPTNIISAAGVPERATYALVVNEAEVDDFVAFSI